MDSIIRYTKIEYDGMDYYEAMIGHRSFGYYALIINDANNGRSLGYIFCEEKIQEEIDIEEWKKECQSLLCGSLGIAIIIKSKQHIFISTKEGYKEDTEIILEQVCDKYLNNTWDEGRKLYKVCLECESLMRFLFSEEEVEILL